MRRASVIALAVLTLACGKAAPAAHESGTTPTPVPPSIGIAATPVVSSARIAAPSLPTFTEPTTAADGVLMLSGQGTSNQYSLFVIRTDGRILRSVTATIPQAGSFLPRFSVAGRSVYFLDGDQQVKALREDGAVATLGQLPGSPTDRVVFAVSPDELQIAFTVLHYSDPCHTTTSIRVGRLDGSGVHEIFSGSTLEFPIAWHAGRLVIATVPYACIQNAGEVNPYFAFAYHIVDADTATRRFTTSPTCDSPSQLLGPVNSFGAACLRNGTVYLAMGWDGSKAELFRNDYPSMGAGVPAVLNPDGQSAVVSTGSDDRINIIASGNSWPTAAVGTPGGWFDHDRLLFMTGSLGSDHTDAAILDVATNSVTPVGPGLTGAADPYAPFFVPIPNSLL